MKSPLAGQGLGQKIATIALVLLALIAALAFFGDRSGCQSEGSAEHSSSRFTPASSSDASSGGSHLGSPAASTRGASSTASRGADDAMGSKEGLTTVLLADLPREAQNTAALIKARGPFPYRRDGSVFGNNEGGLPAHPRGWYHEYTVPTPGASSRGVRRLITGKDATMY